MMLLLIGVAGSAIAQVTDTISINPGYTHQVYYSMENGESGKSLNNHWDLQFATDAFSASIRVNGGEGTQLYRLQNGDTSQWISVDTSGMAPLYNSDTSWEEGAFNAEATGHPDYGWGFYIGSGNLVGKEIFALRLTDGTFRKIWVQRLDFGITYWIRIANLDNTGDTTFSVSKSDFMGKNFFYYSVAAHAELDLEPDGNQWDIVFRRYLSPVAPNFYYPVIGALNNYDSYSSEARGVDVNQVDPVDFPLDSANISVIGYDWKAFNMDSLKWVIEDSLIYFVSDVNGSLYKLLFLEFGGSASGNIIFQKTEIISTQTEDVLHELQVKIFPNPTHDLLNVQSSDNLMRVFYVVDINGRVISKRRFQYTTSLDMHHFSSGQYFLIIDDPKRPYSMSFSVIK